MNTEIKRDIDITGIRITFGEFGPRGDVQGRLVTRLPVSYLKWLATTKIKHPAPAGTTWSKIALAELERRATSLPKIILSGHAIDRASLKIINEWHKNRREEEGFHSWLLRMAREAIENGSAYGERIEYAGINFIFELDQGTPILKTITIPNKRY